MPFIMWHRDRCIGDEVARRWPFLQKSGEATLAETTMACDEDLPFTVFGRLSNIDDDIISSSEPRRRQVDEQIIRRRRLV